MHEVWSSHETWLYECQHCHTTWDLHFNVRHGDDGHGGEVLGYEHHGHRSVPPWADKICPTCGSQFIMATQSPLHRSRPVPVPRGGEDIKMVFHLRKIHAY